MQLLPSVPEPPQREVEALSVVATEVCGKRPYYGGTAKSVFGLHSSVSCFLAIFWLLVIGLNVLLGLNFFLDT